MAEPVARKRRQRAARQRRPGDAGHADSIDARSPTDLPKGKFARAFTASRGKVDRELKFGF